MKANSFPLFPVLRLALFPLLSLWGITCAHAQPRAGIKTNLLYGIYTSTPNLGVEIGLNRCTTFGISGGYNPWNLHRTDGSKKRVHYLVQPEFRYFFGERFAGHFLGVHALYAQYNINAHELPMLFGKGSVAYRHEGAAYGGGLNYGYQFSLARHWGVELSIGAGMMQLAYDKFDCVNCGERKVAERRMYYGVTQASVSLVYLIKGRKQTPKHDVPAADVASAPPMVTVKRMTAPETTVPVEATAVSEETVVPQSVAVGTVVADSLSRHYPFLAPLSAFSTVRQWADGQLFDPEMPLNMGKGRTASQQSAVEQLIADNEPDALWIHFDRGSTAIDRYYKENNTALVTLASVLRQVNTLPSVRISKIVVAGFAPIEGTLQENDRLAWERADAVRRFICQNTEVPFGAVYLYSASEDWHRLRRLVERAAEMESRYDVLRIIDKVSILGGREKQLMDLAGGVPYRYMKRYLFPRVGNGVYVKVYYENK